MSRNFQVTLPSGNTITVHKAPVSQNVDVEYQPEEEEVMFVCPSCPKSFYNLTALRNHHSLMHGNLTEEKILGITTQTVTKSEPSTGNAEINIVNIPPVVTPEINYYQRVEKTPIEQSFVKHENVVEEVAEEEMQMQSENQEAISVTVEDARRLVSLASQDLSYIIVKTGEPEVRRTRKATGPRRRHNEGPMQLSGPFTCHKSNHGDKCEMQFSSCCEYTMHYSKEHTKRRKPGLKCQVCEKELETEAVEMAGVNPRPRPWACNLCSKTFTQQGGLIQHMRMHTGQRPFPCSICGKTFTQKAGLDQHTRTHTKTKPFRCVICEKGFAQAIHLRQHMRTHTNISPFECSVCKRKFKQASHLNFHLKTHQPLQATRNMNEEEMVSIEYVNDDNTAVEVILSNE